MAATVDARITLRIVEVQLTFVVQRPPIEAEVIPVELRYQREVLVEVPPRTHLERVTRIQVVVCVAGRQSKSNTRNKRILTRPIRVVRVIVIPRTPVPPPRRRLRRIRTRQIQTTRRRRVHRIQFRRVRRAVRHARAPRQDPSHPSGYPAEVETASPLSGPSVAAASSAGETVAAPETCCACTAAKEPQATIANAAERHKKG